MEKYFENITIVLISHNSYEMVTNFIKNLSNNIKIIVIDNSKDLKLKKELENKKNVCLKFMENKGYGSAINFARKLVKTKFFFVFSPDIKLIDDKFLKNFVEKMVSINEFAALGPRFLDVTEKSHKQSDPSKEIGQVESISGASMLFDTRTFDEIGGFDENIFLFFEDSDFSKRARKKGYKFYQINSAKVNHLRGVGDNVGVVKIKSNEQIKKLENLYSWHFIWSKYYFLNKHYGKIVSLIVFFPILIRVLFRICFYYLIKNNSKKEKYKSRLSGFVNSFKGNKSSKRM